MHQTVKNKVEKVELMKGIVSKAKKNGFLIWKYNA